MLESYELLPTNRLLAALPQSEYRRILPHLESVPLPLGEILNDIGESYNYTYFPETGMISLVLVMENGATNEVGIVGREGVVGVPVFLGGKSTSSRAIVQVAGSGLKLPSEVLEAEFWRGGALQRQLLLYAQALLTQVSQTAACNAQHTIEKRLARWLLIVHDSVGSDELLLTQEFISQMLGTRRSSVTIAAGFLQKAHAIRYSRGRITILDRNRLEAIACECYATVRNEFQRLLN